MYNNFLSGGQLEALKNPDTLIQSAQSKDVMAGEKPLKVPDRDPPVKLDDLLKEDRGDDCLSCRIIGRSLVWPRPRSSLISLLGGGTFLGLAAYVYISGQSQLQARRAEIAKMNTRFGLRSRSLGITGLSVALAWVGLWRLVK